MITENFFDETARLAKERNLKTSFETALGDVSPGDILQYLGKADVPMCEFWQPDDPDRGGEETKPILPAASATHIYGKRRLAAESFTSVDLHWNEHPGMLKAFADHNFAQGITHLVFHTYTHNPRTDLVPGTTFGGGIGTPFLRGQTWWQTMPAFTDYLARCNFLLEQGAPVSDVLWYLGDEVDHKPRQDAPFPKGYRFDYCNPDVLLHRVSVKNGILTSPEGVQWRLLWLRDCLRLTPETLVRLKELLRAGATVLAAPPSTNATLSGAKTDARFAQLKAELWGHSPAPQDEKRIGAGRLLWGIGVKDVLQNGNYALTNAKGTTRQIEIKNARTQTLNGPWNLHFPRGWDAPETTNLPALQLWSQLENPAARSFSGSATYECEFTIDNLVSNSHLLLDLGDVKNSADIKINGQRAALLWTAPFRCDVTRFVKAGANRLEVTVTNTWRNRLSYEAGLPEAQRKTWTIAAPPANITLEPAGLSGPVRLMSAVNLLSH